jgi:3-hydroxyisobutyrate dehydrogenase-like beta-hydroxyacid dehydrogenase
MTRANGADGTAAVAVLGTGIMGSAMARNLAAAGLTTHVWDRDASATVAAGYGREDISAARLALASPDRTA